MNRNIICEDKKSEEHHVSDVKKSKFYNLPEKTKQKKYISVDKGYDKSSHIIYCDTFQDL